MAGGALVLEDGSSIDRRRRLSGCACGNEDQRRAKAGARYVFERPVLSVQGFFRPQVFIIKDEAGAAARRKEW
jgi:hypothetical protein